MIKLLILLIGLYAPVQIFAADVNQADATKTQQTDPCNCLGCCGNPLSLLPGLVRAAVISPIAIFWDRGPTFAEW